MPTTITVPIGLDDKTWGRLAFYAGRKKMTAAEYAEWIVRDRLAWLDMVDGIIHNTGV